MKPDSPFPRHWLYDIVLKYAVIAATMGIELEDKKDGTTVWTVKR
jgi:hypothetical protein